MHRRHFLQAVSAGALCAVTPSLAYALGDFRRLLILVELKGGNDGLNTVVPFNDPLYYSLRPRLAVKREEVIQLDAQTGLHPALQPLQALWLQGELAVVQSVGYAQPNLSHFRSIEIWDTGATSKAYLPEGWLARVFARHPVPAEFLADGVLIGSSEMGPLAGARAVALRDAEQFKRQARLAQEAMPAGNAALQHVLKVESDISQAGRQLDGKHVFRTEFPKGEFGQSVHTACQVVSSGGVAVLRLTLNGFDTHQNQSGTQANLLRQLAEGLLALRSGLTELNRWQDTLLMTYAEFGRRPKANESHGTDHGTAAPHFVLGGRVKGGLYGPPPALDRLDGNGNLPFAIDFRQMYATAIENWWGLPALSWMGGRQPTLPLLRA
jgi:uncharacterized protein (DUF1501 family)